MKAPLLLAITLLCPLAFAQTENDTVVTKVVRVRGNADQLAEMVRNVTGGRIAGSNSLGAVIISGKASQVDSLEKTILEIDSGSRASDAGSDIELTAYVLAGFATPGSTSVSDPVSPALEPVVRQMQAIFPSKQYRTLGVLYVRSGQNSRLETTGSLKPLETGETRVPSMCQLRAQAISLEKNNLIHLRGFAFSAKLPVTTQEPGNPRPSYQITDIGMQSEINLHEGQKAVVSKSDVGFGGDSLFLVLSAHVVR